MPKIIPTPGRVEKVVAERDQLSHGRLIHVVSVFPRGRRLFAGGETENTH